MPGIAPCFRLALFSARSSLTPPCILQRLRRHGNMLETIVAAQLSWRSALCPLFPRLCCKTIFAIKTSNIDSKTSTSAQYRFKIHFSRIQLVLVHSAAKSFATQSPQKRTFGVGSSMSAKCHEETSRQHRLHRLRRKLIAALVEMAAYRQYAADQMSVG